jgi:hypothetical protein
MTGCLRLDRFVMAADGLYAAGVFTGELADAGGTPIGVGSCRKAVPAAISRGASGIVAAIGPVDIDLLGLVVTISPFSVEARVPVTGRALNATVLPLRRRPSALTGRAGR